MSSAQENKSGEKQRQRRGKAAQRDQKDGQQRSPKLDRRNDERIDAMIASTDLSANSAAAPTEQPLIGEVELSHVPVIDAAPAIDAVPAASAQSTERVAASGETLPVNVQTIANAYRDYARKSFQENRSFVERLMGVRSFDKAVEVQTDYARQTCANFVAESQKICGLYTELARQTFSPWKASRPG
jgi:hypothetical protein